MKGCCKTQLLYLRRSWPNTSMIRSTTALNTLAVKAACDITQGMPCTHCTYLTLSLRSHLLPFAVCNPPFSWQQDHLHSKWKSSRQYLQRTFLHQLKWVVPLRRRPWSSFVFDTKGWFSRMCYRGCSAHGVGNYEATILTARSGRGSLHPRIIGHYIKRQKVLRGTNEILHFHEPMSFLWGFKVNVKYIICPIAKEASFYGRKCVGSPRGSHYTVVRQ